MCEGLKKRKKNAKNACRCGALLNSHGQMLIWQTYAYSCSMRAWEHQLVSHLSEQGWRSSSCCEAGGKLLE